MAERDARIERREMGHGEQMNTSSMGRWLDWACVAILGAFILIVWVGSAFAPAWVQGPLILTGFLAIVCLVLLVLRYGTKTILRARRARNREEKV